MATFEVGQRVVCVDDVPRHDPLPATLKRGRIYTIVRCYFNRTQNAEGVFLAEVTAVHQGHGFFADRFEPLPKKSTSIEVFRCLLVPGNMPQKVD